MASIETIISEYDSSNGLFLAYKSRMHHLVEELLESHNIKVHNISSRCKERESLKNKALKKDKYNSLSDITDIVGVRIITFFEDQIDAIANLIKAEFIIDEDNSIDKRIMEVDRFGYASLHFVVSLKEKRGDLVEYSIYKNLKFEIQIRSILQHAWAEIEHDIGYKMKDLIPDIAKRNFSRISALLEIADLEFTKLKNALQDYGREVENEILENPQLVDLNKISLLSYAESNQLLLEMDRAIAGIAGCSLVEEGKFETEVISKLKFLEVLNIEELDFLLRTRKDDILDFTRSVFDGAGRKYEISGSMSRGISLFYLCYLLVVEKENDTHLMNFVKLFWGGNSTLLLFEELRGAYENYKEGKK